jgi:hypothetical protein
MSYAQIRILTVDDHRSSAEVKYEVAEHVDKDPLSPLEVRV